MKKVLFFTLFLVFFGAVCTNAQVTIGDDSEPHPGAVLDLKSTKGLKLPTVDIFNVNEFQLSADKLDEATGMIVYNTYAATAGGQGKGVYVWDGAKWMFVAISGGAAIPVTTITVNSDGNATNVTSGATLLFTALVEPSNATNRTITWSVIPGSGNGSITQAGIFTAGQAGTVTVRATANDGSQVFGTRNITVDLATVPVTGVTVAAQDGQTHTSLNSGSTLQLVATVAPPEATNKSVKWEVITGDAATVSTTGLVTGAGNGAVVIRVTSLADNTKYADYPLNIVGSQSGAGTVTGSNGTYTTWCFTGTPGNICWMTQNSKEGTYASAGSGTYTGRGYYYTWANATASSNTNACPSGWTLPNQTQWDAFKSYLNGTPDATFKSAWLDSAKAGYFYAPTSTWNGWNNTVGWWSSTASNQYYMMSTELLGPGIRDTDWYSVRCVKSN